MLTSTVLLHLKTVSCTNPLQSLLALPSVNANHRPFLSCLAGRALFSFVLTALALTIHCPNFVSKLTRPPWSGGPNDPNPVYSSHQLLSCRGKGCAGVHWVTYSLHERSSFSHTPPHPFFHCYPCRGSPSLTILIDYSNNTLDDGFNAVCNHFSCFIIFSKLG